jgi:hypothetical protein
LAGSEPLGPITANPSWQLPKNQFKAANARGAAAVARGPIAQAARYDSRRGLIVITLEGGC